MNLTGSGSVFRGQFRVNSYQISLLVFVDLFCVFPSLFAFFFRFSFYPLGGRLKKRDVGIQIFIV